MNRSDLTITWGTFTHPIFQERPLYLARTEVGLCRITWPTETFETLKNWVAKHFPEAELVEDQSRLLPYIQELEEYCNGERTAFTLPIDMRGTSFQTSVWKALQEIPFGVTKSYSDIAERIDNPKAVRAVGTANGANPIPIIVPCHRVIGKSKALTGFRGGLKAKERLLTLEGFHGFTSVGHKRFQF
ncbi:methylated-DNA--[protein]-cysteine S-methyltransferase [Pseudalkalibacillus sp. SCS-8]|uniref:methylated-DNA--[protein]-cysteine S-methyltransferase n=1 Tax=Pseudalkalibacillus nanhaiensis TaxID=3115291 RepID=UPI0032D9C147